ncbi:sulfotransferase family 2 domain-containing protein [Paenibacillus sp. GYB004]|uniref:sulfotransferase family 2 domain-containing protein n=1 Tax=Paenibacillus sp. GYB004 TaxID=2994393 RepID=UPI002F96B359
MEQDGREADSIVIVMHIPKTAGSTMRTFILDQYEPGQVYRSYREYGYGKQDRLTAQTRCIIGHDPFGTHHQQLTKPYTYATMLRDPVERVLSEFYYLKRWPRHDPYISAELEKRNWDLDFYIGSTDEKFLNRTFNTQTRYAAGQYSPDCPDLELAKANLSRYFSVVGITDMFDDSLSWMRRQFGWRDTPYRNRNVAPGRPGEERPTGAQIARIAEMNGLDIKLYEWGKANLLNRLGESDK